MPHPRNAVALRPRGRKPSLKRPAATGRRDLDRDAIVDVYSTLPTATPTLSKLVRNSRTTATWQLRARVRKWLPDDPHLIDDTAAVAAVEQMLSQRRSLDPMTLSKDITAVKFWLTRLLPRPERLHALLSDAQAGLRLAKSKCGPPRQAFPLLPATLATLLVQLRVHPNSPTVHHLRRLDLHIRRTVDAPVAYSWHVDPETTTWTSEALLLLLAYRTASRIHDLKGIASLTISQAGLVVQFGPTKTNPLADPRPDHAVLLRSPGPLRQLTLRQITPKAIQRVKQVLTHTLVTITDRQWMSTLNPNAVLSTHLQGHSPKRGGSLLLFYAAAARMLSPSTIAYGLKHLDVNTSMRYAPTMRWSAMAFSHLNDTSVSWGLTPSW